MLARRLINRHFSAKTFKASDLKITRVANDGLKGVKDMTFGSTHTAHMLTVDYLNGVWEQPEIKPYAPLSMDPFNSTLHYAVSCFEGLKAYKDDKHRIRLFRPDQNMERFSQSCSRLALGTFDKAELLKCIEELVKLEKNWIPSNVGESLYLRPFAFSMENTLGVKPPSRSRLMVVASPVGNYFGAEFKPISLGVCREYERGNPRSAAGFKIASNYAPTIQITGKLKQTQDVDQILWLYNDKILEVGACNIFFLLKTKSGQLELVTAPLDGSILPGVTRSAVLELEREKKRYVVSERDLTMTELKEAHKEGRVVEIFGTGTAVCIMPVNKIGTLRTHISC